MPLVVAIASLTLDAVILNGAPPDLPLARAAAKPAFVLSMISSLSNSAKAAKILNTNFPEAVVVSRAVPCPVKTRSCTSLEFRL